MGVSGVRSQSTTGRGRLCAACSCLSLVLGVLLLALGFWSTYMHVRFTPVYSDITCTLRDPKLAPDAVSRLSLGSLDLVQETVCYNPNPYSVKIMSTKPSGVFIGDDRRSVGAAGVQLCGVTASRRFQGTPQHTCCLNQERSTHV